MLDDYLQLFDFPSPNLSAEKRFTTSALAAPVFMNSDFMQQQAERLARIVEAEPDSRPGRQGLPTDSRPRAE
jgi:hypothetical protein